MVLLVVVVAASRTVSRPQLCELAEARLALARTGAPACYAVELREALAACLAAADLADGAEAESARVRLRIGELADSLKGHPSHRASFLARHAGGARGPSGIAGPELRRL